jgi:hypothetical protein
MDANGGVPYAQRVRLVEPLVKLLSRPADEFKKHGVSHGQKIHDLAAMSLFRLSNVTAGMTSSGKSTFCREIAMNLAVDEAKPTLRRLLESGAKVKTTGITVILLDPDLPEPATLLQPPESDMLEQKEGTPEFTVNNPAVWLIRSEEVRLMITDIPGYFNKSKKIRKLYWLLQFAMNCILCRGGENADENLPDIMQLLVNRGNCRQIRTISGRNIHEGGVLFTEIDEDDEKTRKAFSENCMPVLLEWFSTDSEMPTRQSAPELYNLLYLLSRSVSTFTIKFVALPLPDQKEMLRRLAGRLRGTIGCKRAQKDVIRLYKDIADEGDRLHQAFADMGVPKVAAMMGSRAVLQTPFLRYADFLCENLVKLMGEVSNSFKAVETSLRAASMAILQPHDDSKHTVQSAVVEHYTQRFRQATKSNLKVMEDMIASAAVEAQHKLTATANTKTIAQAVWEAVRRFFIQLCTQGIIPLFNETSSLEEGNFVVTELQELVVAFLDESSAMGLKPPDTWLELPEPPRELIDPAFAHAPVPSGEQRVKAEEQKGDRAEEDTDAADEDTHAADEEGGGHTRSTKRQKLETSGDKRSNKRPSDSDEGRTFSLFGFTLGK